MLYHHHFSGARFTDRLVVWWLVDPQRFTLAVKALHLPGIFNFPVWAYTLVGFIFMPWTTLALAYLYVIPNGIVGFEWIVLAVAILIDLFGHSGSYRHRNPIYRRRQTI